jgi:3-phenylpropionate/trans-cinnamate dioxygenase ferredoxin reductase subunit
VSAAGIVIVGGSYAGLNAAAAARAAGFTGPITLVGDEPHLPYQRPPLSKDFLKGRVESSQLPLRAPKFFDDSAIELRRGHEVVAIDRHKQEVVLAAGDSLPYAKLVLATGCRPRKLSVPGSDAAGIHCLRTLDDAQAIARECAAASRVAIVGGGFIGLEIAAALRTMGKEVVVVEAQARLLARALPRELAAYIARRHEREGVRLVFDAQVASFPTRGGRVDAVLLADGTEIAADLVIVGIGVVPNQELAQAAGLRCDNGIVVDERAATQDQNIYAAGDCTSHPNPFAPGMTRLECVQNAIDQGRVAGTNAAGASATYAVAPWFWSDQYDLKLQGVGISTGYDRIVRRGDMEQGAFSFFYFRGERLLAVESINKPGDHMLGRKLLAAGAKLSQREVEDTGYDLKQALAQ